MQVQSLSDVLCTYVVVVASDFTKVEAPDRTRIGALCRCRQASKAGVCKTPIHWCKSSLRLYTPLAQLVEQGTLNAWVEGSSPSWCTNIPGVV